PEPGSGHTGFVESAPLDDALTVFAATAPRYGSLGLANHGPMAAEALAHLGREDAIADWVEYYRRRLEPAAPRPTGPSPRRTGRRPSVRKSGSGNGSPCSSARSPTDRRSPSSANGSRASSPAR